MAEQEDGEQVDRGPLIKRLRGLPEAAMRRQVLVERLQEMEPIEVLGFFSEVLTGAEQRSAPHLVVLDAVHEAILSGQESGPFYELLAEVYRLAREIGNDGVVRLLVMVRPQRGPLSPEEIAGDFELSRLTLGERKSLARGHDRTRLDRLLFDPEPSVVRNLLRNPHLTEQDVMRLAARRPTLAEVQKEIYESRWGGRYRIRLTLVCNPYTPTDLSVKLVDFLLRKDLLMVRRDGNLHPLVRDEARRLLSRRGRRSRSDGGDEERSSGPCQESDDQE